MEREDAAGHRGQEEGEAETEGMSEHLHAQRSHSTQYSVLAFHETTKDCADSLVAAIDGRP